MERVKTIKGATGEKYVTFVCPGCKNHHTLPVGDGAKWQFNGNMESPTIRPSILARSGHYAYGVPEGGEGCYCNWAERHDGEEAPFQCFVCHSFVTDGHIQFLNDCTHELRGQTVQLSVIDPPSEPGSTEPKGENEPGSEEPWDENDPACTVGWGNNPYRKVKDKEEEGI
jgi:hypothetical protein